MSQTESAGATQSDIEKAVKQARGFSLGVSIFMIAVACLPDTTTGAKVDPLMLVVGVSLFGIYLVAKRWTHPVVVLLDALWCVLASLLFVENLVKHEASVAYNVGGIAVLAFFAVKHFLTYRNLKTNVEQTHAEATSETAPSAASEASDA